MNVEVKFEVGDTMWFMQHNKVTEATISSIKIEVTLRSAGIRDTSILVVPYNMSAVSMQRCFKTKEELLKSL